MTRKTGISQEAPGSERFRVHVQLALAVYSLARPLSLSSFASRDRLSDAASTAFSPTPC